MTFRGPLPSCERAGRIAIRGKRGANELKFFGRVRGRELAEGTYVLTLRARSGSPRRVAVRVVEEGAQRLSRAGESAAVAACTTQRSAGVMLGPAEATTAATIPRATNGEDARATRPTPPNALLPQPEDDPFRVVLPDVGSLTARDELPLALGVAALTLLGAAALGIVVFLLRFFRPGSEL